MFKLLSSWRERASCRHASDLAREWFFGNEGEQETVIAAFCAVCPVRRECLTDARKHERNPYNVFGVRGGLTQWERGKGRNRRQPTVLEVTPLAQYTYSTYLPPAHRALRDDHPDHRFGWVKRIDHYEANKDKRLSYQARCTCKKWKDTQPFTSRRVAMVRWSRHLTEALKQGELAV